MRLCVLSSRHQVHCRVGSSENLTIPADAFDDVHCRVGSSEKAQSPYKRLAMVHCRVGSSEIRFLPVGG